MNITDVYKKYKIMPMLELHQLRVAAVANIICESINQEVDKENIIKACLLHDMGNIIKFKLGKIPEAVEPLGIEYWQEVQNSYINKYGKDEHQATLDIINELGQDNLIYDLVNCVGFHTAKENRESNDFNRKICAYADMRVTPYGVTSLQERLDNLKERYHGENKTANLDLGYEKDSLETHIEARELFETSLKEIEKQIFENCVFKPEDINDDSVKQIIDNLKSYVL